MSRREWVNGRVGSYGVEDVVLPNGVAVTLEVLRHPGASAVLPVHDDGSVTLVRQFRHATGGWILEIPAGRREAGETPEDCAAREMAEEVGLAGDLAPLGPIWPAPAYTDEQIHLFVATRLREVPRAPDADEVLEAVRLTPEALRAHVASGAITDAKTLSALYLASQR
jgi:ADP-ribose pyrophosphatase